MAKNAMQGTTEVYVNEDSTETVTVTITDWNNHDENGSGTLADGTPVDVITSYDGDGYLVLDAQSSYNLFKRGTNW